MTRREYNKLYKKIKLYYSSRYSSLDAESLYIWVQAAMIRELRLNERITKLELDEPDRRHISPN